MIFHDIRKLNLKVGDNVHLYDGSKNIMHVTMVRDNYFMLNNKKVYQSNGIVYQGLLPWRYENYKKTTLW
jgi:hypothetical protein